MEQVNQFLNQNKLPIALSFAGGVLIIGGIFSSSLFNPSKATATKFSSFPKESLINKDSIDGIKVDISGAVKNVGVYSLSQNSRVVDAIKSAGGFSENANSSYISKNINLSQKITDGMKIYIPFAGEQTGGTSGGSSAATTLTSSQISGKVGLNTATAAQLDSLPSIGQVTANKIITGRPYSDLSDLISKKIISNSIYLKIKDLIDLN